MADGIGSIVKSETYTWKIISCVKICNMKREDKLMEDYRFWGWENSQYFFKSPFKYSYLKRFSSFSKWTSFTIHDSFMVRYGKSGAQILVRPECEAAGQKRIGRWGSAHLTILPIPSAILATQEHTSSIQKRSCLFKQRQKPRKLPVTRQRRRKSRKLPVERRNP